jgi:hypothetical protein
MANTTFKGPVRSQNGFNHVSTTGTVHSTAGGTDSRRYTLEETFKQKPALNAVLNATGATSSAALIARTIANRDFEVLGTNMTTALATFDTTRAGITLTTATADEDQAVVTPHLDTNQTAWANVLWGTENQVRWQGTISTNAIDNQKIWAGLKLTYEQTVATDDDQAFFKFQTDATNSEAFDDYEVLHFIYSVGGTDYISALPITVAANTTYDLVIDIDSSRQATIWVNGVQYNVTQTAGSTGGTAVTSVSESTAITKSLALTNDIDLIPYIGIEAGAAAAEAIDVHYTGISRVIFE